MALPMAHKRKCYMEKQIRRIQGYRSGEMNWKFKFRCTSKTCMILLIHQYEKGNPTILVGYVKLMLPVRGTNVCLV